MLSGMRNAQKGWLGKIIVTVMFGFLILSFGIWGIGDIFRISHREVVASVGSREIGATDYRYAFQSELQRLSYRARRNVTQAQALAAGIDRQVLATMLADAALDQKAQKLGLAISDKAIREAVFADPAFRGPDGKFDANIFAERLRESGYTEQSFLTEQRGYYLRRQIVGAIAGAQTVPALMLSALHRFTAETRAVDYFVLGAAAAGDIAAPDDAALAKFYNDRKAEFAAPEYRSLIVLPLEPAALAKPDSISEADARAEYDKVKEKRFTTPEKRSIERIPFKDAEAAHAAEAKLKAGTSFDDLAKEMDLTAEDLSLGAAMTKDAIDDPKLADAAFSQPQGTPSDMVDTKFGPVILRVTKIEAGGTKPFEEVSAQLRQEIATERAKTQLRDLRDKIEDQRASAKPIAEIAKEMGLPSVKIDAVDAQGNGKDGKPVEGIPDKDLILKAAFQSEVGADNDAVSLRDGGYAWYDVTGQERAHDRPLAEVRDNVVAAWTADQRSQDLAKLAASLVKEIDGGKDISDIAKERKVELQSVDAVARSSPAPAPGLSPAAVNAVFSVKSGGAGYALGTDAVSRVVFKVKSAVLPPDEAGTSATLKPRLADAIQDDLMQVYVRKVEGELGVTTDAGAARAALRGAEEAAQE